MTYDEVIVKLQAASTPSDHLDFAVAEAVGTLEEPDDGVYGAPGYTYSLDAALSLVPEGWRVQNMHGEADDWFAELCDRDPSHPHCRAAVSWDQSNSKTWGTWPALALCIAALKARQAMEAVDA
jgi:hypothetical protein